MWSGSLSNGDKKLILSALRVEARVVGMVSVSASILTMANEKGSVPCARGQCPLLCTADDQQDRSNVLPRTLCSFF